MSSSKKGSSFLQFVTIIGLALCAGIGSSINPIIQKLIDMYPETPVSTVRTLSTIVSLMGVCISLPLTLFFGKKIKFKPFMILAAVFTLGGMLPFFVPNPSFGVIMLSRILVGIGFGFVTLRNACIRKIYADDPVAMAKYLGFASSFVALSSAVASPIVGALGDIDVKYAFVVYAIAIIPLLINTFILKEPESGTKEETKSAPMGKINPKIFIYSVIVIFGTLISFPIFTGMSTLITSRGIGEAAVSGTVTSFYTIGQVLGSAVFGTLLAKLGKRLVSIDLGTVAVGFALIVLAQNAFVAMAGAFLCGFGFIEFSLIYLKWAGDVSDESTKTFASTLLTTSISIGSFFSSYWMMAANKLGSAFAFLPTDAERTYLLATILFAVIAVIMFIRDPRPNKNNK